MNRTGLINISICNYQLDVLFLDSLYYIILDIRHFLYQIFFKMIKQRVYVFSNFHCINGCFIFLGQSMQCFKLLSNTSNALFN